VVESGGGEGGQGEEGSEELMAKPTRNELVYFRGADGSLLMDEDELRAIEAVHERGELPDPADFGAAASAAEASATDGDVAGRQGPAPAPPRRAQLPFATDQTPQAPATMPPLPPAWVPPAKADGAKPEGDERRWTKPERRPAPPGTVAREREDARAEQRASRGERLAKSIIAAAKAGRLDAEDETAFVQLVAELLT
jgi:hypothetical protein